MLPTFDLDGELALYKFVKLAAPERTMLIEPVYKVGGEEDPEVQCVEWRR
jgi:hypothetical protein